MERINMSDTSLKSLINLDALCTENATHVITGIYWGANAIASFEYNHKDSDDQMLVKGKLESSFNILKALSGSAQAQAEYNIGDLQILNETNISFKADIELDNLLPQTAEETLKLFQNFPKEMQKTNNGKGIPLFFEMLPLDEIISSFDIKEVQCSRLMKTISLETIQRIEIIFDNLLKTKQELNDLIEDCEVFKKYLNKKHKDYLLEIKNQVTLIEHKIKENISSVLYDVRAGLKKEDELDKQMEPFKKIVFSSNDNEYILKQEKCQSIIKKIEFLKYAKNSDIFIVENTMSNIRLLINSENLRDKKIYVFKISDNLEKQNKQLYDDYWDYFLKLKRSKSNEQIFYLFDYDILNDSLTNEVLCIEFHSNGRLVTEDFFTREEATVKNNQNKTLKLIGNVKPAQLIELKVPCPNSSCPSDLIKWKCDECREFIKYDGNLDFFCKCASSSFKNYGFKCVSKQHPEIENDKFLHFQNFEDLKQFLLQEFHKVYKNLDNNNNSGQKFAWCFLNQENIFQDYDSISNKLIEICFIKNEKTLKLTHLEYNYMIDFKNLTQTNIKTNKVRQIRRYENKIVWASQNSNTIDFDKTICQNLKVMKYDVKVIDDLSEFKSYLENLNHDISLIVSGSFFLDSKNEIINNSKIRKILVLTKKPPLHVEDRRVFRICTDEKMVIEPFC
ncbi:unnamed protein product [Brachionus calyciflorus]|uniref:WWE domain-containing protein n=1 Tax=Brachionus calyciflorus TaxID=104777 RepID=A0A813VWP2_9BILA|nr:unnamed protein product [Brachionus calyciflorus]